MDTTKDTYICCLQETNFRPRNTYRLKARGWKKIFHANGNQKSVGVAILISDKIEFNIDAYKRQRRTLYNDQGINPRRNISIVNIYGSNVGAPKYLK